MSAYINKDEKFDDVVGDYIKVKMTEEGITVESECSNVSRVMLVMTAVLYLKKEMKCIIDNDEDFRTFLLESLKLAEDTMPESVELDLSGLRALGKIKPKRYSGEDEVDI